MLARLSKLALGLSPREALFETRGFEPCDDEVRERLERVLRTFIAGYNAALAGGNPEELVQELEETFDGHHVGFAFEGAGMCYALWDLLLPGRGGRLRSFTDHSAPHHDYIATVGAGFAVARVPWGRRVMARYLEQLEPLIGWCVFDGYGFHQGFFHHRRFLDHPEPPPARLPAYGRQLFDSGLGRSLWWVKGASPGRIKVAIDAFEPDRRAEMWCGLGVVCAYACGVGTETLLELRELAGPYRADLLSGVPFAARMRQKAGDASIETERTCQLLLGTTGEEASRWIVEVVDELAGDISLDDASRRAECYRRVRERLVADLTSESDPHPSTSCKTETVRRSKKP